MLRLLCLNLPHHFRHRASPQHFSHAHFFSKLSNSNEKQSFTVSFLQNSCGLSLESAISASKKLNIENRKNFYSVLDLFRTHSLTQTHIKNLITSRPVLLLADLDNTLKLNMELFESLGFSSTSLGKMLSKDPRVLETDAYSVVKFFRAHGFSDQQILTLTMKRPTLYLINAHKILKPKLEFFKTLGLSELEIAKLLSNEPYILERSLENQIIPCVQELKRILGTDENVLKAIKACYQILEYNVEKVLQPNISVLLSHGVPQSLILKMFMIEPKSLLMRSYQFSEIVGDVVKLGFNPNNLLFVLAIRSMATLSKALWEQKVEAYKSFGLSMDEFYSAFKRQPMCMLASENKIRKLMSFFVNKLNMTPLMISKNPNLLLLSLEKRIIPRCSVLHLLMSKGLIKEDTSIVHVFKMTEKSFVEKLVSKYQNEVPDVVRAHQGMIEFQGFHLKM
jgi:mTERF domain-containing protein